MRREPQQARSRKRVEAVLDAADEILVEEGAAALSTTKVAARAGVSVGSLYQWFSDKESIVEGLALRYVDEFEALAATLADQAENSAPSDPIGVLLDAFIDAFRGRPGFRAMWFGGLRTQALRDATRPALSEIGLSLRRMLRAKAPDADPQVVATVARMVVVSGDALLRQAFTLDPQGDPTLLEETRVLLRAYVTERLSA